MHPVLGNRPFALIALLATFALLAAAFILLKSPHPPEVQTLAGVQWTLEEYRDFFLTLAEQKGVEYAYDVLGKSHIAAGIDTHMLAHDIGYVLYRKKGVAGIAECTSEFKNGCVHAIVTQELVHSGSGALGTLSEICGTYPPNTERSVHCFHGIGHGLVAAYSYDFKSAALSCAGIPGVVTDSLGSPYALLMWGECIGGAMMELSLGIHDAESRDRAVSIFFQKDDVLAPCNAPYLDERVRSSCYLYLRERFFDEPEHAAEPLRSEDYRAIMQYCARIPADQEDNINACYGGFGIEYVYIANGTDSRSLSGMSDRALARVHEWCGLGPDYNAVRACTFTAAGLLTGGEHDDPQAAIRFCARAPDSELSDRCFSAIISAGAQSFSTSTFRTFCLSMPRTYIPLCLERQ